MGMKKEEIISMITNAMPDAKVEIKDLAGDDNHYAATITSTLFQGKTKVNQHKMVYDALEGKMGGVLHALSLTTLTPKD
ncbi:MAG: BolA family transcriptional regulator [Pelagibacterales bacterium]|nr:BolA family transcriptional regulator [Pelagibacterales bacterium]OUU62956.1 MAG: BolA family transcriptional regulator [Alphaproteobacteria bacterium TMED62]|tara:strand:+ start:9672 stop:9908 length:237 start_codon:yes stop_codon:yes gene_type:complete